MNQRSASILIEQEILLDNQQSYTDSLSENQTKPVDSYINTLVYEKLEQLQESKTQHENQSKQILLNSINYANLEYQSRITRANDLFENSKRNLKRSLLNRKSNPYKTTKKREARSNIKDDFDSNNKEMFLESKFNRKSEVSKLHESGMLPTATLFSLDDDEITKDLFTIRSFRL